MRTDSILTAIAIITMLKGKGQIFLVVKYISRAGIHEMSQIPSLIFGVQFKGSNFDQNYNWLMQLVASKTYIVACTNFKLAHMMWLLNILVAAIYPIMTIILIGEPLKFRLTLSSVKTDCVVSALDLCLFPDLAISRWAIIMQSKSNHFNHNATYLVHCCCPFNNWISNHLIPPIGKEKTNNRLSFFLEFCLSAHGWCAVSWDHTGLDRHRSKSREQSIIDLPSLQAPTTKYTSYRHCACAPNWGGWDDLVIWFTWSVVHLIIIFITITIFGSNPVSSLFCPFKFILWLGAWFTSNLIIFKMFGLKLHKK